jgi:hypothetical protein
LSVISAKRLHLLGIGVRCIANAAFHRLAVLVVDRSPANEAVHTAAQHDAEAHRVGRVALNDPLRQSIRQIEERHGVTEIMVNAL